MIQTVISAEKTYPPGNVMKAAGRRLKPGNFVCPLPALRAHVETVGGLSDSGNPDSQQRALRRCVQSLRDKKFIEVHDEWLWLTDKADKGGQ